MQGQMTRGEKLFELLAFLFLLIATGIKCVKGVEDIGALVIMAFVACVIFGVMIIKI